MYKLYNLFEFLYITPSSYFFSLVTKKYKLKYHVEIENVKLPLNLQITLYYFVQNNLIACTSCYVFSNFDINIILWLSPIIQSVFSKELSLNLPISFTLV